MRFAVGATSYRAERLDARSQFLLLGRLTPLLPALDGVGRALSRRGQTSVVEAMAIIAPLATASEEELEAIIDACLATCEVLAGEDWISALNIMDALELGDILEIVAHVIAFNYQPLFAMRRIDKSRYGDGRQLSFTIERMHDDLDWLLRPVLRGLCRYESIKDGTLHIEDFAEMNDLLDVSDENQHRAQKAADKE